MKRSKFTEKQIFEILRSFEGGVPVSELSRKYGVSVATIYNWRTKYHGMSESDMKRLRHLEEENRRLKKMYAEACMDNEILKDVIAKKL